MQKQLNGSRNCRCGRPVKQEEKNLFVTSLCMLSNKIAIKISFDKLTKTPAFLLRKSARDQEYVEKYQDTVDS